MKRARVGKLPPRYSFLLNAYPHERLSKCPVCEQLTHLRKFALFIHVEDWGPLILGKSCRYCTPCELIMAHCNELEAQLSLSSAQFKPHKAGSGYLVIGTVDRKEWQKGLDGNGTSFGDVLSHMADFKKLFDLHVELSGWHPTSTQSGSKARPF
jgi:hypothetical protein